MLFCGFTPTLIENHKTCTNFLFEVETFFKSNDDKFHKN